MDLMYGTPNKTKRRSRVETKVTTKPGVAGRIQLIGSYVVVGKDCGKFSYDHNLRHRLRRRP